jgi:4-alpha-glucanotransferase
VTLDPDLAEWAAAHGVATTFDDWRGVATQPPVATVIALLAALGVEATSPATIRASLQAAREAPWRRMLPPYLVVRAGRSTRVGVHVPHGAPVRVRLALEDGGIRELAQLAVWVEPREVGGGLVGEATFEIPDDVELGYHTLHATSDRRSATAQLIVVPDRLAPPTRRAWGYMAQLYALRSSRSWSMGDLGDLRELASLSASKFGAGFLLVNPLHATAPVPPIEPSPYFPTSRGFASALYLDVAEVAEQAGIPAAEVAAAAGPLQGRNQVDEEIDRDAVWAAKRPVLERAFAASGGSRDDEAFAEFAAGQGDSLTRFATWCALADHYGASWREWPEPLRDPTSAGVAEFAAANADLVDFHRWLQWLCARQLDAAHVAARAAGMPIGIVHDLAVGSSPLGADAWAWSAVLATGVTLGAPADMYNQQGQDWSLPPWRPDALAAAEFRPYRDLLRGWFGRGGGLRIDHVLGLFRQWWVPEGAMPAAGAYLRLDHEAMVGIAILEAHRAGAVLIGEDLGTVEPWVRGYLRERGVFGMSILWFEHDEQGRPRRPAGWRDECLATATTHDLPPSAGYLTGEHVEIRARLGLLDRDAEHERIEDEAHRLAWLQALGDEGVLDPAVVAAVATGPGRFADRVEPHLDRILAALYAYLARTPSLLLGVYLPDVAGDRRPINQPGTSDAYPNWRLPMVDAAGRPVLLDEMFAGTGPVQARARRLARLLGGRPVSATVASDDDRPRNEVTP